MLTSITEGGTIVHITSSDFDEQKVFRRMDINGLECSLGVFKTYMSLHLL